MKKKISLLVIVLLNIGIIVFFNIRRQYKPEKIDNLNNKELKEVIPDLTVKWDENKSIYINEIHGIKWSLPRRLNWTGRPIVTESTIFKIRDDDNYILLSINVNNAGKENLDAWDVTGHYKSPEYIRTMRKIALQSETIYIDSEVTREIISGIHANKIITEYQIVQTDFPVGYYRLQYQYQLGNGENVYTFNITGLYLQKTEYKKFDKIANDIINGLVINKL